MTIERPVLAAGVQARMGRLRVGTPFGQATFSSLRTRRLRTELARWDGTRDTAALLATTRLPRADFEGMLAALDAIGAVIDARATWRYTRRFEINPAAIAPVHPECAYDLPRWEPRASSTVSATSAPNNVLTLLAAKRASVALDPEPLVEPRHAAQAAFDACLAACDQESHAIASAGALQPIHILLAHADDAPAVQQVVAFTERGAATVGRTHSGALRRSFVADAGVQGALDDGASVVVICADPSRETAKYSDRGWLYCQMEAGAYAHHIALLLTEADCEHRMIGGFYEAPLMEALGMGATDLQPLLTILVTGGGSQ